MPQTLEPFQRFPKTNQQINCQIPLNSMEKCQYTTCQSLNKPIYLEKFDKYWCEFFKAQQDSTANYLYKFKIYGDGRDPTLEHKEPISESSINQRLLHMPYVGGLFKGDMYYLLSFILNLMQLDTKKQQQFMEYLQQKGVLDKEILNYLQIIARQPNAGLSEEQLHDFQEILKDLIEKFATKEESISFYNAQHIFLKSCLEINPYELEYLKNILHSTNKLNLQQSLYLANFVNQLYKMDLEVRQQYLKLLHDNHILPFSRFETLETFMRFKCKKINQEKLKILLRELFILMDLKSCLPDLYLEPKKVESYEEIQIDYIKINKAFKHLMKAIIPNIVRLTDLKYFLKSLVLLHPVQIEGILQSLKFANILYEERFNYIEKFINEGRLGKVDKAKRKILLDVVKKVASEPESTGILIKLDIPASKGPPAEKIERKVVEPPAAEQNAEEMAKTLVEQEKIAKESKGVESKDTKGKSSKKEDKSSKKGKKKAGKKKK